MDDGSGNATTGASTPPPTPNPAADSDSPGSFSAASFKSVDDVPVKEEHESRVSANRTASQSSASSRSTSMSSLSLGSSTATPKKVGQMLTQGQVLGADASIQTPSNSKKRRYSLDDFASPQDVTKSTKKFRDCANVCSKKSYNPFERRPYPFGGVIADLRHRFPFYWTDVRDALSLQCLASAIYVFFAALSGAVSFGGILGDSTRSKIGVSEMLMSACGAGIIFSLFSAAPTIIVGPTGPLLVFDVSLLEVADQNGIEFLPWRFWVSVWCLVIALIVAFFQGSVLVKYFTRFTRDIFATLISGIYIYEALENLYEEFHENFPTSGSLSCPRVQHSEMHGYEPLLGNATDISRREATESVSVNIFELLDGNATKRIRERRTPQNLSSEGNVAEELFVENMTKLFMSNTTPLSEESSGPHSESMPNVALMSAILMVCTYYIAIQLKHLRHTKFLGRPLRRFLSNFSVVISIVAMVGFDLLMQDDYTNKLRVPPGAQVTDPTQRGWIIPPLGADHNMPIWQPFAAILPAILLYLILFMETHICELVLWDRRPSKGVGLHWDIVLLSLSNVLVGGVIGGAWMCAATVRAGSHLEALTLVAPKHLPGEKPKVIGLIDQRISQFLVALFLGLSIFLAPALALIPNAVLFGVFLYMGFSNIGNIQMFDRVALLFLPVKYHPNVTYVKRVRTWRMHLFTLLEVLGLVVLGAVLKTRASLAFPFVVAAMVPYRMSFKFIFTEDELDALDGPDAGSASPAENSAENSIKPLGA